MQSILLTTPSKISKSEVSQETKIAYDVANVDEKGGEEKSSDRFATVMDSLIKRKNELIDGELASKIISGKEKTDDVELTPILLEKNSIVTESVDGLEINKVTLVSSDASSDTSSKNGPSEEIDLEPTDEALAVISDSLIPLTSETETFEVKPEIDAVTTEQAVITTSDPIVIRESTDEANNNDLPVAETAPIKASSESSIQLQEQAISPIIAQIESAQKIDTNVSDYKPKETASEASIAVNDMKAVDKHSIKDKGKTEKVTFDNVLVDDPDAVDKQGKELISKNNVPFNEKLDAILPALKAEINKPALNLNVEGNVFNTAGMAASSADKLLNQISGTSTNPALQSSVLQQPLELHAKHASAIMGERILMMLGQGKQEVTIRLDPAELGSMHIKLHVQQDQLQVAIQTQVGQSRDIIEQNLPRLREQLAQQGINLGEASVEHQSNQNQSNSQHSSQMESSSQGSKNRGEVFSEDQNKFIGTQIPLPAQGIDYYA
jgi:flagellar hook-length control protein FliK